MTHPKKYFVAKTIVARHFVTQHFAAILGLALILALAAGPVAAKSPQTALADNIKRPYIVVLNAAPLVEWHRKNLLSPETSPQAAANSPGISKLPAQRLNVQSIEAQAYLKALDEGFEDFRGEAALALGREINTRHRYRNTLNGFSAALTPAEAQQLSAMPQVRFVQADRKHKLHTDAGPAWIGADDIWNGVGPLPQKRGEGIVIGVIDSGINSSHLSFADPMGNGGAHDFVNPLGAQKGLCSDPEVTCNDKLIGIWDFVEDDPSTTDVVEENTKGEDNSGHGTHVASIAAGNLLRVTSNGIPFNISGVAPRANLIAYRVCFIGDPDDSEDDSCQGEAIISAIDQAVTDGVDVINYSLGSEVHAPWNDAISVAMLNAVGAGIFVATSAGNDGPAASSIGSPGNAPWVTAVGNATHNRLFGSVLENLTGGDTTPPADMFGASLTGASGFRPIVHAKDFGNAQCIKGTPELGSSCDDNTGTSNPFAPGTFNGEIVVCDRGVGGRIEKSKNLQLAGAGGMVLANTDAQGESLVSDDFCIPGIHIGDQDGDVLRAWLDSGNGHGGSISASGRILDDALGDRMASSSSRGPNPTPADVLKPDLVAPGVSILGAFIGGNSFAFLTGTSMSSPHIAGSAALLLSLDNTRTPSMLRSALALTANPDRAIDFDLGTATPHVRGAGTPDLLNAANSGIYLPETVGNFQAADPAQGGNPRDLNLPGLEDSNCNGSCSFNRTVTDLVGGRSWTASATGFPAGVNVAVTPSAFTLSSNGSANLSVDIDLTGASVIGLWVYGEIVLSASNVPDAVLPVAVYASGGTLPVQWDIFSAENSGSQEFAVSGLALMPQATFTSGGLTRQQTDSQLLAQDPTRDEPYDGGAGIITVWHQVPQNALWLHTETLQSTAVDIDLYVGLDSNQNGVAEESEEICSSTTPIDRELCDIFNPVAGNYWVIAQNWAMGPGNNDEIKVVSAVIAPDADYSFSASGPGLAAQGESFNVRLAWEGVSALDTEVLLGAVGFGTHRDLQANIGVVPVYFNRTGIAEPKTLPLMDGVGHQFALGGLDSHDRIFIDIPPGATSLTVSAAGEDAQQNNGLSIDMYRVDFDNAFSEAPFASQAPGGNPVATASGSGGNGPALTLSGGALQPGRWYAVISNGNPLASSVTIRADVLFSGPNIPVTGYLWISAPRPGISQGIDYQPVGAFRGLLWYAFADNQYPAWYLAAAAAPAGNIWTADLLRFTNDGAVQQFVRVGAVAITMLGTDDSIFSWTLFGESGSERMDVIAGLLNNPCPTINSQATSISGFWGKAVAGLGGASVLYDDSVHAQIHYMFDDSGNPVWLQAVGSEGNNLTMTQFQGFCPTCATSPISNTDVGVLTHNFLSESGGNWTLNYMLIPPLSGNINRNDPIIKLSDIRACD